MKVRHEGGIVIQGVDNLLIRLSRCCNPVPGDEIVGYITKGRGVSIHRADCPNVQHQEELAQRLVKLSGKIPSTVAKNTLPIWRFTAMIVVAY